MCGGGATRAFSLACCLIVCGLLDVRAELRFDHGELGRTYVNMRRPFAESSLPS